MIDVICFPWLTSQWTAEPLRIYITMILHSIFIIDWQANYKPQNLFPSLDMALNSVVAAKLHTLCHHISKHLNICWSTWLYLVFQAVSLVLGMWSNTLLHVTNKNVPWCVKFAEYLDFMLVFTVGLQVTWERLRQLGDSPVGRDGHTLRLVQSEGEGVLSRPASTGGRGKMCSAFMLLESCYTTWGWLTREGPVGSWSFFFFCKLIMSCDYI